jgi:hypothetical protein
MPSIHSLRYNLAMRFQLDDNHVRAGFAVSLHGGTWVPRREFPSVSPASEKPRPSWRMIGKDLMVCGACDRVIENDEVVEAEHPTAKWIHTCHRVCWAGRFHGRPLLTALKQAPNPSTITKLISSYYAAAILTCGTRSERRSTLRCEHSGQKHKRVVHRQVSPILDIPGRLVSIQVGDPLFRKT